MQKVMTVSTTKLRKKSAVMKVGKRSTEKLIEILKTSPGEASVELVRKILRSVLLLGDRVCVDECAQLDGLTLRHVFNVLRTHAKHGSEFQMWMSISGHEFVVRSEPFENDRF